jgi:hypothetical protein
MSDKKEVCCGILEKMSIGWMKLEDGRLCMPYIIGKNLDETMYRVNNCPSCGKYVRDIIIDTNENELLTKN